MPTSAWWAPQTWEAAKAAHQRAKDAGDGPAAFNDWIHEAIETHAARGVAGRANLQLPERPVVSDGVGRPRAHPLRLATRELLDQARADDEHAGRRLSISAWIYEAVAAATIESHDMEHTSERSSP